MTAHPKPAELEASTPIVEQKVVNLALQGGGSHGAFTWGVLDRLLEDGRLAFDGITATSAGAVNAVVLADGLALGGREGARNALKNFWQKMSQMASSSIIAPSFFDQMNPKFGLEHTPAYVFIDVLSRILSPYQLNPMDINPLKDLLNAEVADSGARPAPIELTRRVRAGAIPTLPQRPRMTGRLPPSSTERKCSSSGSLKHPFEPSLFEPKSPLPGNGIFRPETNGPKRRRSSRRGDRETKPTRRTPPIRG